VTTILAPLQVVIGDWAAREVASAQPTKLTALEGLGPTTRGAPEHLLGWYNGHEVVFGLEIPRLLSVLAFHNPNAAVQGLDAVPPHDRPPVNVERFAFQTMVGIGTLLALLGVVYGPRHGRTGRDDVIGHSGLPRPIRRPISRAVTAPTLDDHCRHWSWRSLGPFSAWETAAVRRRRALAELRTMLTGVDPGRVRLRLAGIGTASMVLATAVMSGVRAVSGQPVTVELFAAVLAMISNLAVNEPDVRRMRMTTLLMLVPAAVSLTAGTLLGPHRVLADVMFVTVTMVAVYIRRFGPRGFALGMAAFMPFFLAQFLHISVAQLPWLLLAAATGIGSTLLLRGWAFAERPELTLYRLVRAFRAHLHTLVEAVADLLAAVPGAVDDELRDLGRHRTRLNDTGLLLADSVEQRGADHRGAFEGRDAREGTGEAFTLGILDAELAAERLAVATERLAQCDAPLDDGSRRALLAGLQGLGAASATGTPPAMVAALLEEARRSVSALAAETQGRRDRTQRVAFAVIRLADALEAARRADGPAPARGDSAARRAYGRPVSADRLGGPDGSVGSDAHDDAATTTAVDQPQGLPLSTRQAVQVGIATSLAIVVGELVSPARWYWAVLTAFLVFAGTSSRGDVLSRGGQRIFGTIAGVLAGMGLAVLVSGHELLSLLVMFGCAFLALYLVRISQTMQALWITAVLAVLYGLIGQFSVQTLVLRIEETAIGAAMGMLAAYLVLPKRTREAFGEALDDMVDAADAALAAAVERILGREPARPPGLLSQDLHKALSTLRERSKPLDNPLPWRRGRSSYQRTLRVLTAVDHYARSLAQLADHVREPGWAPTLQPATACVRTNLNALRQTLHGRQIGQISSAEDLIDAAEAYAAHTPDPDRRAALLKAARPLRRIDQVVVKFATDLGPAGEAVQPQNLPATA
jgi:Cytochrome bd terminal oxidase subunit I/Fusaric acid resistance protein-like